MNALLNRPFFLWFLQLGGQICSISSFVRCAANFYTERVSNTNKTCLESVFHEKHVFYVQKFVGAVFLTENVQESWSVSIEPNIAVQIHEITVFCCFGITVSNVCANSSAFTSSDAGFEQVCFVFDGKTLFWTAKVVPLAGHAVFWEVVGFFVR